MLPWFQLSHPDENQGQWRLQNGEKEIRNDNCIDDKDQKKNEIKQGELYLIALIHRVADHGCLQQKVKIALFGRDSDWDAV